MKIIFRKKKFGITWYRIAYCCGTDHYVPLVILKLKFIFKDVVHWQCPVCGHERAVREIWYTTFRIDEKSKNTNKKVEENKQKLKRSC